MSRLTQKEKEAYRNKLAEKQHGLCMLCETPLGDDKSLDHCHTTGHCRAVLHRWCNAQLGRVENAARRNGKIDYVDYLRNCVKLLESDHRDKPFHNTHLTDTEKEIKKLTKKMNSVKRARTKQKYKDLINELKESL